MKYYLIIVDGEQRFAYMDSDNIYNEIANLIILEDVTVELYLLHKVKIVDNVIVDYKIKKQIDIML